MRVLVEILHPAHVHFFKNAISHWRARGDEVLVLSREKEVANELLQACGIPYISLSRLGKSKASLFVEMIQRDVLMWKHARKFKPDVLVGIMGVTIVQVGKVLRKPAIVFYDTENAKLTNRVVYPLAHSVCTPECYSAKVRGRHVTYPSYHELSYLHPNRFTKSRDALSRSGVTESGPFFVLRFVSWQASHDLGEKGFDTALKRRFVTLLEQRGQVVISSEAALPEDLEKLRYRGKPEDMHHLLAFADLLVGESATMASEAAVLGTEALYIADTGRGYTDELEARYGLVKNFRLAQAEEALAYVESLLSEGGYKTRAAERRDKMLEERIDATTFILDYIDQVVDETRQN